MHGEDKAWIEYRHKFSEVYDESNYSSPLQSSVIVWGKKEKGSAGPDSD